MAHKWQPRMCESAHSAGALYHVGGSFYVSHSFGVGRYVPFGLCSPCPLFSFSLSLCCFFFFVFMLSLYKGLDIPEVFIFIIFIRC